MFNRGMVASLSLAAALVIGILAGCEERRKINAVNVDEITVASEDSNTTISWREFENKGHKWIWARAGGGHGAIGGLTHHPDCPCLRMVTISPVIEKAERE